MRLLDLWQSDPGIESKRLEQIIAFAGDGRFAEDNDTSREFRSWHVRIKRKNGRFTMSRRKGQERIDITKYLV